MGCRCPQMHEVEWRNKGGKEKRKNVFEYFGTGEEAPCVILIRDVEIGSTQDVKLGK